MDTTLGWVVFTLVFVVALFETTSLDLLIQDRLYDPAHGRWLLDARAPWPRMIFHHLPVALSVGIGLALLAAVLAPGWLQRLARRPVPPRRALLCALLTIVSVPLLIAGGKRLTNMFCPSEVRRYGGDVCYVRLFEPFPENDVPKRRGLCFPAAHASGGFALIGLFALARTRRQQLATVALAFSLGWIAGGYQMITGSHYLSHTLVTLCLTWIVFLLWRRALGLPSARSRQTGRRLAGLRPVQG